MSTCCSLIGIAGHIGQGLPRLGGMVIAALARQVVEERDQTLQQRRDGHRLDLRLLLAHGVEQRSDDVGDPVDLAHDHLEVRPTRMIGGETLEEYLRAPRDDVQRGAHFVRDAGGELARHRQRLGAAELVLELEGAVALEEQALARAVELLGHAVECLRHLAQLVAPLHRQGRPRRSLAEGADRAREARQRPQDLAREHQGGEPRQPQREETQPDDDVTGGALALLLRPRRGEEDLDGAHHLAFVPPQRH